MIGARTSLILCDVLELLAALRTLKIFELAAAVRTVKMKSRALHIWINIAGFAIRSACGVNQTCFAI